MNGTRTVIGIFVLIFTVSSAYSEPVTIGADKQLFIDFSLVESYENMTRVMNPPVKRGVVIHKDKPWETGFLGGYGEVINEDGLYRMWYEASGKEWNAAKNDSIPLYTTCYATSKDGITWGKPILAIHEFQGGKENNIVLPFVHHGTVFKDPTATPDKRYKTIIFNGNIVCQYAAYSADGVHDWKFVDWKLYYLTDTQNMAFWDDQLKKYVLYFRGWTRDLLRSVVRVETNDFLAKWPFPEPGPNTLRKHKEKWAVISDEFPIVIRSDERDPEPSDYYNPCVVKYSEAPNVYFAFPSMFFHLPEPPMGVPHTKDEFICSNGVEPPYIHIPRHYNAPASPAMQRRNVTTRNSGFLDIRFMSSRDGIHWNKDHRGPYVPLGIEGDYDTGSLYMFVGMIIRDGKIYQYYSGNRNWHSETMDNEGAIMMVEQRLDGFVSADAAYEGGEIITKPVIFKGTSLHLNINTSAIGSAAVALLDENGRPFPGYDVPDCDVIRGNFIDRTVSWHDNSDIGSYTGKPIRLRIIMRDSKLFSLQFK